MLDKILKSTATKPLALVLAFVFLSATTGASAQNVTLKAGTNIPLETVSNMNTEFLNSGQIIDIRVVTDIKVDNKIVIKGGTIAKGQVVNLKKNGAIGAPGKIDILVKSVQSIDGQEIFLTGGNIQREGDNKLVLSIALSVLICPLFLLLKGKNAEVPAGTQVYGSVASETSIAI